MQPVNDSATATSETSRLLRVNDMGKIMWILMLEGGVALFLLVFIVWWTMYQGKQPSDNRPRVAPPKRDNELGTSTPPAPPTPPAPAPRE